MRLLIGVSGGIAAYKALETARLAVKAGHSVRVIQTPTSERFVGKVLPDSAANPDTAPFFKDVVGCPHSVVTAHLIDEAGQPTIAARDEILAFFAERLS